MWISALQTFILNRSFISSHDWLKEIASVTIVCIKPHDFTLANLGLLSCVRSTAISLSISKSSNLAESCSLKVGISCIKEECVSWIVYVWNTRCLCTGADGCGWWMAIDRLWSSCCMQSRVSASWPSPTATLWGKSFISLVSAVSLSWSLYTGSSGCSGALGLLRQLWHPNCG